MSAWKEAWQDLLEEVGEDDAKVLQDVAAVIYAGLDQVREELNMGWQFVKHQRMVELSQRVAVETKDWSKYDGMLVGTWMMASCRRQIEESDGVG